MPSRPSPWCVAVALSVALPAWADPPDAATPSPDAGSAAPAEGAGRSWAVPVLHATGLLLAQRVGAMILWQRAFSLEDGDRNLRFLREAYTRPPVFDPDRPFFEWDGDRWYLNVVGHGLMGSEAYLRARQCGHTPLESLAFTAGVSVVWEYAVEVWNAHPSLNDLVWTPLGGMLLGEGRFALHRAARDLAPGLRVLVRALVDPFGELERALGAGC